MEGFRIKKGGVGTPARVTLFSVPEGMAVDTSQWEGKPVRDDRRGKNELIGRLKDVRVVDGFVEARVEPIAEGDGR